MIFDDIREVMNSESAKRMSKRTGLSRNKVKRLANGLPFNLDYNTYFALKKLGYEIKVERKK